MRSNCFLCGRPWIGLNKCTCYMSRYRESGVNSEYYNYFKEYQKYLSDNPFVLNKNKFKLLEDADPSSKGEEEEEGTRKGENGEGAKDGVREGDKGRQVEESGKEESRKTGGEEYEDLLEGVSSQLDRLNKLERENRERKRDIINSIISGQRILDNNKKYRNLDLYSTTRSKSVSESRSIQRTVRRPPSLLLDRGDGEGDISPSCLLDQEGDPIPTPAVEGKCPSVTCDHRADGEEIQVPKYDKVDSIDKLIEIARTFHCRRNKTYSGIDMRKMYGLIEPLEELKGMIGLKRNKEKIVEQIVFFLKGYGTKKDMLHTVITGPPGTGKTTFARIIGRIYSKLGLVSKGHFVEVARDELIGQYLGHTAPKTRETIDKCVGGIMFIDEVYALGHTEKRDSFSKECLDILNQRLSEERDMLCIIAGYRDDIESCFFNQNKGLKRRFPFVYDIEGYNSDELVSIFKMKMNKDDWTVGDKTLEGVKARFNKETFSFFAGDVETLVFKTKIAYAQNNFYNTSREIDTATLEEVLKTMEEDRLPKLTEEERKRRENEKHILETMYA